MPLTRRAVLGVGGGLALAGCLAATCAGDTYRLSLSPAAVDDPAVDLDASELSPEGNAVVETAIEDEHVEQCVKWERKENGTGSPGLREVGARVEAAEGELPLAGGVLETTAARDGETYRLELRIETE